MCERWQSAMCQVVGWQVMRQRLPKRAGPGDTPAWDMQKETPASTVLQPAKAVNGCDSQIISALLCVTFQSGTVCCMRYFQRPRAASLEMW